MVDHWIIIMLLRSDLSAIPVTGRTVIKELDFVAKIKEWNLMDLDAVGRI